jgi:hypothetical protein
MTVPVEKVSSTQWMRVLLNVTDGLVAMAKRKVGALLENQTSILLPVIGHPTD